MCHKICSLATFPRGVRARTCATTILSQHSPTMTNYNVPGWLAVLCYRSFITDHSNHRSSTSRKRQNVTVASFEQV